MAMADGGLQIPELDRQASNASQIAAFRARRKQRRLTHQYKSLAQQRYTRRTSLGQNQQQHQSSRRKSKQQESITEQGLQLLLPPILDPDGKPVERLESVKSSHAYEANTINWKEAQEEKELKKRQQKVLQSAGTFRRHMYDLTESMFFSAFILAVILLNTAILCALTFNIVVVRAGNVMLCNIFSGISKI